MTTTATALTPVQFTIARALAREYGHLWGTVPDGTYSVDAIAQYSASQQHSMLPDGIYGPDVNEYGWVKHTTGSGRLTWQISREGNVILSINRPELGEIVAVFIDNGEKDYFDRLKKFSVGDVRVVIQHEAIFKRHVLALLDPLLVVLSCGVAGTEPQTGTEIPEEETPEQRDARWAREYEAHQAWQQQVMAPIRARARDILKPLFDVMLPEPFERGSFGGGELPVTYWTTGTQSGKDYREVCHQGASFPVESERVAVRAVLLLQNRPGMSLLEAIRQAIMSEGYRPEVSVKLD